MARTTFRIPVPNGLIPRHIAATAACEGVRFARPRPTWYTCESSLTDEATLTKSLSRPLKRLVLGTGVGAACLAGAAVPSAAHPHMWVDVRVELRFDGEGRLAALRQVWLFDDLYTAFILDGMDGDGDGLPDQVQLDDLMRENLSNLKEFDYFTEVTGDVGKATFATATEGSTRVRGHNLEMSFTVPLAAPMNPGAQFTYAVFDPTYYIDMLHAEGDDAIRFAGAPAGCNHEVIEPNPDPATVELAASLDITESAGDTLGAFFAERVVVRCAPVG